MSQYDNKIFDSDLDAFKNAGAILTASITFSGVVASGARQTQSTFIATENPDFFQILFDNNQKHSGKFKSVILERITSILETTGPSEVTASFQVSVSASGITIGASLFNPYTTARALQTTTINFRFIPYQATI